MNKIAIVSCFWVKNYGSVLQAYATQYQLQKMGFDVETINYSDTHVGIDKILFQFKRFQLDPFMIGRIRRILNKKKRNPEIVLKITQRHKALTDFVANNIILTPKFYDKKKLSCIVNNYDSFVVGSDQLWLPYNILVDYYTLNFVPKRINKVSYATSFGINEIPKFLTRKYQKFLNRFNYISVREIAGAKLVMKLIGREVPVVCDPTLMLTPNDWLCVQKQEPIIKDAYIFCYFLGNNPEHRNFAKELRTETGLKIVSLLHLDEYIASDESYADECPFDIDPGDFLNLIRNAKYILTDSFHCTIFSILHHKTFFVFNRYKGNGKKSTNSRIDSILHLTGLNNRRLTGNEKISDCLKLSINYSIADRAIEVLRNKTSDYLNKSLRNGR